MEVVAYSPHAAFFTLPQMTVEDQVPEYRGGRSVMELCQYHYQSFSSLLRAFQRECGKVVEEESSRTVVHTSLTLCE